ncbi:MAG: hypothetical protein FJ146_18935 [Deltaproteobacteria bacterium]|nr:hypothetical protein [Deltaproteobacteria bacterium]
MRMVATAAYLPLIATMLLSCVDPAPAPPPVSGPRRAEAKAGDPGKAVAASPHVGDKSKPPTVVKPAPAAPAPWSPPPNVAAPQVAVGSPSPPTDNLGTLLSSLLGMGAGALGGASLGSFLGDLIGNQQLGTLLGSVAGATLGGGLSQGTQDPTVIP